MQTVALSWLMTTISTSAVIVALVQAAGTLPVFFLAIFVGAIADNFSRRTVMIIGRILMMAASAMLTVLMVLGIVDPWVINEIFVGLPDNEHDRVARELVPSIGWDFRARSSVWRTRQSGIGRGTLQVVE